MSGRKEDAPHQKAATTSSIWATTKLFERSLRQGSSWVGQKVGLTTRVEDDANVDVKVHEFEQLKSTQKQIARLLHKYVEEQRAVKDTERALGMMLSEIGARETRPNMSRCLTDAGRILSQTTVRREGALEASEDFLKQVELFLDTAVRDVKDSLVRYDSTRRASSAAIETLAASRSAQQDPERRQMLQGEVDATGDKYRLASWQLSQKTLILTLHRNQALCDRTSKLMTQWAEEHTSCAELFSAWPGFVADEHDQMSVIQEVPRLQS
ncbi:hypothetical protein T484DRAFT_3296148 [Baffinella frigidus]|nr:hypothetical protein T484DRAFT_3296148 [Cryptophyta sp. CCMP2293]